MESVPDMPDSAEPGLPPGVTAAAPGGSDLARVLVPDPRNQAIVQRPAEASSSSNFRGEVPVSLEPGDTASSHPGNMPAIGLQQLNPGGTCPKVDIVFVHGLRGSTLGSWSRNSICWPQDFLKNDLPEARVFSFGWDADVANATSYASQDSIFGHAGTLLEDLEMCRDDQKHPIIFIAHSLGGLLVKQMLIKASTYEKNGRHGSLGNPILYTAGVIFMGTPHRGSDQQPYGQFLADVARALFRQPNTQLLGILHRDSEVLGNQRDDFVTISKKLDVVCFYEELPTAAGTIVPKWSAVYDGFNVRSVGVHANHMEMTKFQSVNDVGYRRVLQHVRRQMKPKTSEILPALHFDIMNKRELSIDPAFDQTCDWLLDPGQGPGSPVAKLHSWLSSESEPLFWISGKAGSGKSTLMKFLKKRITLNQQLRGTFIDNHTIVASFFIFKGDEKTMELQMSREGMVRSLTHQCLKQESTWIPEVFPDLCGEANLYLDTDAYLKEMVLNWDWLKETFSNLLTTAERHQRKILFLIDGLDECRILQRTAEYTESDLDLLYDGNEDEEWGQSQWIYDSQSALVDLLDTFNGNRFVKAFVTSRELSIFESRFDRKPRIRVQDHTANGIFHYCKRQLQHQASNLPNLDKLSSAVRREAGGVFLWVQIVVKRIVQQNVEGMDPDEILRQINSTPSRLGGKNGLYWHMLEQIPSSKLQHASRMLYIMANSPRASFVGLAQLDAAAESISSQIIRSNESVTHASLQELRNNVLHILNPDNKVEEDEKLRRLKRKLQAHCIGLLEPRSKRIDSFQRWATEDFQKAMEGLFQSYSVEVDFMHSTVRDFLRRDFVQSKLKKERFNAPLALVNGVIRGLQTNNHLLAHWLLATHGSSVQYAMAKARRDMGDERLWTTFENMNEIVRTVRQAIADHVASHTPLTVSMQSITNFWALISPIEKFRGPEQAAEEGIDDLSVAAGLGDHAYVESRLSMLDPEQRRQTANRLLAETFTPETRGSSSWGILVPLELIKVLLQRGASLNTECHVPTFMRRDLSGQNPRLATLPVSLYVLGSAYVTHLLEQDSRSGPNFDTRTFSFRTPPRNSWVKPEKPSTGFLNGPRSQWNLTSLADFMLKSGAATDTQLQYSLITMEKDRTRCQDPGSYHEGEDGWHWEVSDWKDNFWRKRVQAWYKWEDAETITVSDIIKRLQDRKTDEQGKLVESK